MAATDTVAKQWQNAYALQAQSDMEVYERLSSQTGLPECHRLHYLQMALEKAAKAYYWSTVPSGLADSRLNRSHQVVEKILAAVVKDRLRVGNKGVVPKKSVMKDVRLFCREIDLLAPAVNPDEDRADNCEYPWPIKDADGNVSSIRSPLRHSFSVSDFLRSGRGRIVLKVAKVVIADLV